MRSALKKTLIHLRDALAWRVRDLLGDQIVDRAIEKVAHCWRPILRKPVFVGILGSAGKTTTKELLLGVINAKHRGIGNAGSLNRPTEVAKTILQVRPTHDFCIVELSEDRPGDLNEALALLQPEVGIVTVVGDDHWSVYGSREAIAAEMGKLVASLPATGTAVLNVDDPLVLAMAGPCAGKVITYGTSPGADLRAEDISSVWPDRLQMTLVRGAERVRVRTQLCGSHWLPSVLGAVGGGLALGFTLDECAEGLANVAPFEGRMQPVTTPEGVTFIRDDYKAPLWTLDACFDFMKAARAKRKIIVIGELQDIASQKGTKYAKAAMLAQEIAEIAVFVGPWASSVLKARKPGREDALRAFSHVRDAAEYLNAITCDGDLVLLKGANKQDHLLRVILARTHSIACWRDDCERNAFCNECPDRNKPSGPPLSLQRQTSSDVAHQAPSSIAIAANEQVIVGLGNPEPRYTGTPHSIGYAVVDQIAKSLELTWEATPEAWLARGSLQDRRVCLIKIRAAMNHTGAGLQQLAQRLSFRPDQCILVHDDLDTPLGSVRTRLRGGAGAHRGVASVLEAFQTDAIRRIKVGVGPAGAMSNRAEYVLTAFDAESRAGVEVAIASAVTRALEMVEHPSMFEPH